MGRGLAGVYYAILLSHVVLAAIVPWLAMRTIYLGLRNRRAQHVRLARWTWPIWLYVSITGVVIYLTLYQVFPTGPHRSIMPPEAAEPRPSERMP